MRALRLLVVLAALLVWGALPASAHSTLERSDPPDGGMVAVGRTQLTLWFGEAVDEAGSSFSVRSGEPPSTPVPATVTADEDRTAIRLETAPLARGTYTITWAVVAEDGHPVNGTVTFGAGLRPTTRQTLDLDQPDPRVIGLRAADLAGTLIALGALSMIGGVVPSLGSAGARARRRILGLGAVGATAATAAATTTLLMTGTRLASVDAADDGLAASVREVLLNSAWGVVWLARIATLAVATAALWWMARRATTENPSRADAPTGGAPTGRPLLLAGGALIASCGLDAWAGHASTLPARSAVAAFAATLHELAAAVWAGGLLVLVLSVVPLMRLDAGTRRIVTPAAWRAFGPMAAVSAVVLLATGIYASGRHVESPATASQSTYGLAVLAKILLVTIALAIAGYNTVVVNSHLADRVGRVLRRAPGWRPRRYRLATTVTIESVILAVAIAVAALMTSVPTAREVTDARRVPEIHSETVDGLFVTVEAVPTGDSLRLVVRTEPVVRPVVAPVSEVEVGIISGSPTTPTTPTTPTSTGGERTELAAVEAGHFEASTRLPAATSWTAQVVIHRTGRPDTIVLVPGSATPDDAPTPLESAATAVSALLLAGLATVVLILRRGRAADARAGSGMVHRPLRAPGRPEPEDVRVTSPTGAVDPGIGPAGDVRAEPTPFEEVGRR